MRRSTLSACVGVILTGVLGTNAAIAQGHGDGDGRGHGPKAEAKLPLCPVMGESIDFSVKSMTDDGPVYFCCKMCVKKFEKQPSKYSEKAAEQKAALAKMPRVQVTCPLSGEPIDKKMFVEVDGKKVYTCCGDCKSKYAADPAKYAAKLAASYTYQTKCPVMGGDINPTVFGDLPSGQRIYYCCPACDEKLKKDPAKYAAKLAEQGIKLDTKEAKKP
jgi:YHS domain-containing protein